MALRAYGQLFVQAAMPAEPPIVVGSVWSDTSTGLLKVCTSVSPYTFVTTHGGSVAWSEITDFTGSSLAQLATRSASDLSSGTLAVARGGTNSGTALSGNSLMVSNGLAIVQGGILSNAAGTILTVPGVTTPSTPSAGFGTLFGTTSNGHTFIDYIDQDGSVSRVNRDNMLLVKNTSGGTLNKGTVININGSTGNVPTVRKADATDITKHGSGVMFETVANNGFGLVLILGLLSNFDTSAFVEGDILWLSATTPGALTATEPTFPTAAFREALAVVTRSHASQGSIEVFTGRIIRLVSLTADVSGTLPATNGGTGIASFAVGDLLYADTTTTLAKRAAVATGSVLVSQGTNTAPAWASAVTIATSVTTPKVIGGTGTTSTLTFQATSGNGATGADFFWNVGNNGATQAMQLSNAGTLLFGTPSTSTNYGAQPAGSIHLIGTATEMFADHISADIVPFAFRGRKARGTVNSPTKTLSGDNLVQFAGGGWEDVTPGWTSTAIGLFGIQANQDFTNANQGTRFIVNLTPNNSTTPARFMTGHAGGLVFAQVSGTAMAVANVGANSCGTSAATIAGNQSVGEVTVGNGGGTQCRVTVPQAVATRFNGSCSNQTTANLCRLVAVSTTTFDLVGTFNAGDVLAYSVFAR